MNYCPNCGTAMTDGQRFCTNCGYSATANQTYQQQQYQQPNQQYNQQNYQQYNQPNTQPPYNQANAVCSPKSRLAAILLAAFVGYFGVHRFYVGKIGTGIVWIFTFGCFGIGVLVDIIMIACGSFTDNDGLPVTDWQI